MTKPTAYLQTMRNEETWTVRLGIRFLYDTWTPIQWEGTDLEDGVRAVCLGAMNFSEDERIDDFYMIGADLNTFVEKCNECPVNWGITVFKTEDYWFALLGYREQYADGEWATAAAEEELLLAVGELNPAITSTAVAWRRDMAHRINPRDENGKTMSRDPEAQRTASKRKKDRSATDAIRESFKKWEGHDKWKALIAKTNAEEAKMRRRKAAEAKMNRS